MNIFTRHYLKKDGAIYRELGELDHNQRIGYLYHLYFLAVRSYGSRSSKRFFLRLIKFCNRLEGGKHEKEVFSTGN